MITLTPRTLGWSRMAEDSVPGGSLNLSPRMAESVPELNLEEQEATNKFLANVNKWRSARELEEVSLKALTLSDWLLCWSLPGAPLCLTILMIILCSFPGPQLSSS